MKKRQTKEQTVNVEELHWWMWWPVTTHNSLANPIHFAIWALLEQDKLFLCYNEAKLSDRKCRCSENELKALHRWLRALRHEKTAVRMKQWTENHLTGHRPLLDFLDLRFIERPSLKRSQFTLQESRKTKLSGESRRTEKGVSKRKYFDTVYQSKVKE